MHPLVKFLSVAAATLLGSVSFPQSLLALNLNGVASSLDVEAEQLSKDGMGHLQQSQRTQAVQHLWQALETYEQLGASDQENATTRAKEVKIIRELLEIYTSQTNDSGANKLGQATLLFAPELGEIDTELKLSIALAEAYNAIGKYEQALKSAQTSLVLAQNRHNNKAEAVAFLALASASQSLASTSTDYREATMAAISSLTTAWRIKDPNSEAKALARLGSVYESRREEQNAIIFARQGLKVARENNVPTAAAASLLTLAGVYLGQGNYPNVINYTEQSKEILQQLKQREDESAALVMQGLAYLGQGNMQQSRQLAEDGLTISREIKSQRIEALALISLSLGYSRAGDLQTAIELINQSRDIAKELKNRDLQALTLEILGEIYRQAGQKERAITAYQEAISISNSFSALAGVARLYQESNLVATAIAYFKQAVNRNEQQIPRTITGLPVWLQHSFPQAIQNVHGLEATNVYRSFTNLLLTQTRPLEAQQVVELLKGQELREYTGNSRINNTEIGQPASLTITPSEEQILKEYGTLISFGYRLDECQQTRCSELEQLLQQRQVLSQQYYQTLEEIETAIRNKRANDEAFVDPNQFALKARKIVEAQPGTVLIYPLVLEDKIWLMWASKGGIFTSMEVPG
ncbi:MAG TPA: tetratricopeptide repeat protein, partial [Coleofasciculaceae cyanobacterium]